MKTILFCAAMLCGLVAGEDADRDKKLAASAKNLCPIIASINYYSTHESAGVPVLVNGYGYERRSIKKLKFSAAELGAEIIKVSNVKWEKGELLRMEKSIRTAKFKPVSNDDTTYLDFSDELGDIVKAIKEKAFPEK